MDDDDIIRILPPFLGTIARAAGVKAALAIADAWGGTTRYIPARVRDDSPLAALVGTEAAEKITAVVLKGVSRGSEVYIPQRPQMPKKLEILVHPGGTRQVARSLRCSETYVRRVRREARGGAGDA